MRICLEFIFLHKYIIIPFLIAILSLSYLSDLIIIFVLNDDVFKSTELRIVNTIWGREMFKSGFWTSLFGTIIHGGHGEKRNIMILIAMISSYVFLVLNEEFRFYSELPEDFVLLKNTILNIQNFFIYLSVTWVFGLLLVLLKSYITDTNEYRRKIAPQMEMYWVDHNGNDVFANFQEYPGPENPYHESRQLEMHDAN